MLFNSLEFAVFLPIVFLAYWVIDAKSIKQRNIILLAASYFFYGWWDWRFLFLIIISSAVDFLVGKYLSKLKTPSYRKILLFLSITVNIGLLGFFKYYDFFVDNFVQSFLLFGKQLNPSSLNLILPVGISFYTFQTLSYTIDVYRRELTPTNDVLAFFSYVSFFPQLVAGPIERAKNLLPQFQQVHYFDYQIGVSGLKLIVWGLFKKIVIADNCAQLVDEIFVNYHDLSSMELLFGAVLFAFQIYGDFSGYSDIAIGTARLFGFNLMTNFLFPYFSRDIAEFWRRWHISLSSWFKDYVYKPLGGSRSGKRKTAINVVLIFVVSGFWHGANWTFIIWGLLNAMYYFPLLVFNTQRKHLGNIKFQDFSFQEALSLLGTFFITCIAWVFFRAPSVTDAFNYSIQVFTFNGFSIDYFYQSNRYLLISLIILLSVIIMFAVELKAYRIDAKEVQVTKRTGFVLVFLILFMGAFKNQLSFIYFQF